MREGSGGGGEMREGPGAGERGEKNTALHALLGAFSTYSAIPMPPFRWDETVSRRMLWFFPAVGLACGGLLWWWSAFCTQLRIGEVLFAAGASALPFLVTGGIHMDGFLDTVDALSSHRDREKKLEILKDPHCGAFAVLWCGVWLLSWFALLWELYRLGAVPLLAPGFVLSRALSGLLAVTLPNARRGGMLYMSTERARGRASVGVLGGTALLTAALWLLLCPLPALCAAALAAGTALAYRRMVLKCFGGVTGDTAGFFLQTCELAMALGVWVGCRC